MKSVVNAPSVNKLLFKTLQAADCMVLVVYNLPAILRMFFCITLNAICENKLQLFLIHHLAYSIICAKFYSIFIIILLIRYHIICMYV